MGLFSFLKRKQELPDSAPVARLSAEPARLDHAERARQREIARATAAKIDEIELEMTTTIFGDEAAWASGQARAPAAAAPGELAGAAVLADAELPDPAAAPAAAPVIEEAALLYAAGRVDAAEQMLRAALDQAGRTEHQPWWMLFDLYQASGREAQFEDIAIDYASHFETSPPAWTPLAPPTAPAFAGVTPTASFAGTLDEHIAASLQRLGACAPALARLEFGAVGAATPAGCALLLQALQSLRTGGCELVLAGAETLVAVLRPMLAIGERASGQAPWLLLLELLQLMNREKDFEETAMDYCVTFEVSPPSFEAPARVATAAARADGHQGGDRFLLPALMEGDCGALLAALAAYGADNDPLVLDCSRLARIDHPAAASLQTQLRQLAAGGRAIELRDLNHMVAALLRLLGYAENARLFAHRY
jgi:ABC-type transporter Mla MlaB component